jgi:MFS family permease
VADDCGAVPPPAQFSGTGGRTAPFVVLFLVNVLNFYDRQALGALTEPLRRDFHLSDTQLGAITTSFTVLYALAGLPLGRLADTWRRKALLAIGVTLWAGLTGLGGLARSYAMLLATRLGVGIGEATCGPAATSWIGDLVAPERRARAMALFMAAVPLGGMLSFAVTGTVAQAYGWRVALALAALPAVALVPALLCLREPERGPGAGDKLSSVSDENVAQVVQPAGPRIGSALEKSARMPTLHARQRAPRTETGAGGLLRRPAFLWIVLSGAVVNFALYSFSTFLPAFLTRFHGLSVGRAGFWTGVGSGAAGLSGALAAGLLGDRAHGHRGRFRLSLAGGAALVAAPLAFFAIRMPAGHAAAAVALIMAAYGLLQSYYGLVYAAIQDIVAPAARGAAMGTYYMAMYLCGASFGPLATGGLSDHFARAAAATGPITESARALGLRQAMYLIPALALALSVVLWAGGRAAGRTRAPHI